MLDQSINQKITQPLLKNTPFFVKFSKFFHIDLMHKGYKAIDLDLDQSINQKVTQPLLKNTPFLSNFQNSFTLIFYKRL